MARSAPSVPPPRDLAELALRAAALEGLDLAALAARDAARRGTATGACMAHAVEADGSMLRRKGKVGQLIERALGASAGSRAAPDFTALGVELKTVPVTTDGRPRESTFVCSLRLGEADRLCWPTSPVRAKLAHVLFVPIVGVGARRTIGRPCFWRPTPAQEAALAADFDHLVGLIAHGQIETLTAHHGRWLQVRPKAAHGRVRTLAYGPDEEPLTTIPRGFYLRARCVGALLRGMAS
jgi:DNA mismatch repair protein MutH